MSRTATSAPLAIRHLRRNVTLLLTHGLLGQTGFRLLQAPTFLPTFVQQLTGTEWAVGAARAAQSMGMFLSPLIGAGVVGSRRRVRGLTILFGSAMRFAIGVLAILALFAPLDFARWLLWPTLFVWGLASGLQGVTFSILLAKTVPIAVRGRLWGTRNLGSGLTLLLVSALAGGLLDRYGFPRGYGFAFLVAFVLTSVGLCCLPFLREPGARQLSSQPAALRTRIRAASALLGDPSLGPFLRTVALITASRGALPYFIIAFAADGALEGRVLAALTIVFAAAQALSSLAWGWLADRRGFRVVYRSCIVVWLLASATMLLTQQLLAAVWIFLLLGAGLAGTMLCQASMVLEFGDESQRTLNVAASNTIAEGCGTCGFLAAALLSSFVSLHAVFACAALLQMLALHQTTRLQEPRHEFPPLSRDG